jgi:pimeloyl-ACP methyl ester carboxylesterase
MPQLNYIEKGKGQIIVLLHGFCETSIVWERTIQFLSSKYHVIAIDLPGYGKSAPLEKLSMESMAESVRQTVGKITDQKFILVGHSMGGYVALALAEKFPDLVAGLCLFHSTAWADSEEKKQQRNKTIQYLRDNGVEAFIKPFVPPLFYPQNRAKCAADIELLIKIGCNVPLQVVADSAAAMRDRPDRTHVLRNAIFPVLFILGKNDAAVKFEDSLAQINLPSESYIQILADTAHQGVFEREKETLTQLKAFSDIVFSK